MRAKRSPRHRPPAALPRLLRPPCPPRTLRPRRARSPDHGRRRKPAATRDLALPAAARRQPGALAPLGRGGARGGAEADKPILLSIGYAACHWCHVMAHESFEDPDTAALMNALFVNIKVDREERPDIDHLYMSALHALGEQGGWPLTMFLDAGRRRRSGAAPIFRRSRAGAARRSARCCKASPPPIASATPMVTQNAGALRAHAGTRKPRRRAGDLPTPAHLDAVGERAAAHHRSRAGRTCKGAPKFPNPPIFRFLWQNAFRTGAPAGTGRAAPAAATDVARRHLRPSRRRLCALLTDAIWLVPHFEKMLYDNAQILELLAFAHAASPGPALCRARRGDRRLDDARHDRGTRSTAAPPSPPRKTPTAKARRAGSTSGPRPEIDALLGADAPAFKRAYDVTPEGNWEGHTILRRVTADGSDAEEAVAGARAATPCSPPAPSGCGPGATTRCWPTGTAWRSPPWPAPPPCSTSRRGWNAPSPPSISSWRNMTAPDGRAQHAWRLGRVTAAGLLDDQAAMARAALALYEATGAARHLAAGDPFRGCRDGILRRRAGRLLHHRGRRDRRAAGPPAHRARQRHAGRPTASWPRSSPASGT